MQSVKKYKEHRHAEAKERLTGELALLPVKIIILIVLLVMGFKDLGDSVGDTVIGILWIWGAFGFFRKFILKD